MATVDRAPGIRKISINIKDGTIDIDAGTQNLQAGGHKEVKSKPKPVEKLNFPPGALESLRPIYQEAFDLHGDDEFFVPIEQAVVFSFSEACQKLVDANRGKITSEKVAAALLDSEEGITRAKAFGKLSPDTESALISQLANTLNNYWPR